MCKVSAPLLLSRLKDIKAHLDRLGCFVRSANYSIEVIMASSNTSTKPFPHIAIFSFSTVGKKFCMEGKVLRLFKAKKTSVKCTRPQPQFNKNNLPVDDEVRDVFTNFENTLREQGKFFNDPNSSNYFHRLKYSQFA